MRYTAHFTPEAWVRDQAIEVDPPPGEPQEWDCTEFALLHRNYLADTAQARGVDLRAGQEVLDTDDVFAADPAAPAWVRDWRGPFTITIRAKDEPDPVLPDDVIVYLARLVTGDIRKRTKSIEKFAPKDGQDPAEAARALTRFRQSREWRRTVLARLAELTDDPALWRAGSVDELPDDYDPDDPEW